MPRGPSARGNSPPGGPAGMVARATRVRWAPPVGVRSFSRPPDPDHTSPCRSPPSGPGALRSVSPCHSMVSGCRPSCFEPSPTKGTRPPPGPERGHPLCPRGTRPARRRPDGTGKTAAFVLPIIHRLHETRRDAGAARHQVRVLVVVPTRELAIQVEESVRTYGAHRPDPLRHRLRRRRVRAAGVKAARRARDRRGHARPPA